MLIICLTNFMQYLMLDTVLLGIDLELPLGRDLLPSHHERSGQHYTGCDA